MKTFKQLRVMAAVLALLGLLTACGSTAAPGAEASAPAETVKQTATGRLDQDTDNSFYVTVDVSGGWSVEFAAGAVYLYQGENSEAAAIGISADKELYEDYLNRAEQSGNSREYNGSVVFKDEESEYFITSVEDKAYFVLGIENPDVDGEALFDRLSFELLA
jgi:hypothetical protein